MAMCFLQCNGDVFSTVLWRYVFYSVMAMCFLQCNDDVFSEVSEFSGDAFTSVKGESACADESLQNSHKCTSKTCFYLFKPIIVQIHYLVSKNITIQLPVILLSYPSSNLINILQTKVRNNIRFRGIEAFCP